MVRFFPVWMLGFITLSLITTPPVHCNVSGRDAVVALLPCKSFLTGMVANATASPCCDKPMTADSSHSQPATRQPLCRIILPTPIDPSINCTTLRALSNRGGGGGGSGGDRLRHHKKTRMTLKNADVGRYSRRVVDANKKKHPRRRRSSSSQVLSN